MVDKTRVKSNSNEGEKPEGDSATNREEKKEVEKEFENMNLENSV